MGKIEQGILGGFSGKVGNVIGSSWRGIDYMRSRSRRRKSSNTPQQLAQRARFTVGFRFIESMKDLINLGYKDYAYKMTPSNSALAYLLKNAITGVDPDFKVDYSLAKISRGNLPNVLAPAAEAGTDNTVLFNWSNNSGIGKAKAGDKAILVAYCEALNHTLYVMEGERSAQNGVLPVAMFTGQVVHTWISFLSVDGKDVATSIYTGRLTINP